MKLASPEPSVVVAGEFWRGATAMGMAHGLRSLGWNVAEADLFDAAILARAGPLRLIGRLIRPIWTRSYNDRVLGLVRETEARAMIAAKGAFISSETLKALGAMGVGRVNYYPDVLFSHSGFRPELLDHYDLVATTKRYHLDWLAARIGSNRVVHVPHGYSPQVHRRRMPELDEADYQADIAYVGIASPSKLAWMNAVARAFPDRRIVIAGEGWREAARGQPCERHVLGTSVTGDFYARLIETSRINIALHFGAAGAQGWSDDVSTRTYEIPACGGFMLHIDNEEVRTLYNVPGEIDVFASPDELCERIAHYLDQPDARAAMREAAWRRAVPAYGLPARAAALAGHMAARGMIAAS